ncbi:hypothetical protein [Ectobacillus funiculus]|uniref:hypothetical protein n=1 Tax=Ectobacillus funiculus TaxID=137993 RepID=UPI00101BCB9C|nr:hypothetical protein [Ectobacillus funiculus]
MSYQVWRKMLQREYTWLQQHYPLSIPVKPLLVLPSDSWIFTSSDSLPRAEGEVLEMMDGGYMIGISIPDTPSWDEQQLQWAKMYNIPSQHLYAFILYHEYAHLVEMNEVYFLHGEVRMREMIDAHGALVAWLRSQENSWSREEVGMWYRLLPMEEYADRFAIRVYNMRKHLLKGET